MKKEEEQIKPTEEVSVSKAKILQEKSKIQDTKPKMDIVFNKWKVRLNFLIWRRRIKKAKKMTKMLIKDPMRYSEKQRYDFVKKMSHKLVKTVNVKIHVFGIENWLDRGVVLMPNHQSNLDSLLFLAINNYELQQPLGFIAKKELWHLKIVKNFMNLIDNLPLDRNNPRSALEVVKDAKELVTTYKRSMCIFAEGTRSHKQEMVEFSPSSTKIAQMAYCPVVPVAIIDSYKIESKDRPKVLNVKVCFGKPIMPERFMALKPEDLTKNVKKEIQKLMDKYINFDFKDAKNKPKVTMKKSNCYFY